MLSGEVTIVNRLGLHARAAAKFVQTAANFSCAITVVRNGKEVNGKSILGIMMLAAGQGAELEIRTDGEDEESALSTLMELIADRFGEAS
ncbi:MAG: HPr family phosphocarrier protein [Gammaproteobacteria bacterium]